MLVSSPTDAIYGATLHVGGAIANINLQYLHFFLRAVIKSLISIDQYRTVLL